MSTDNKLEEEEYYHGLLPREDLPHLLIKNGDFLVRTSEPKPGDPRQTIISIMVDEKSKKMRHVVIQQAGNGKVMTDARRCFDSVPELVDYFVKTGETCIMTINNAILINSVKRAPWELKHEDIKLTKKLGEGAFGEVHAGLYTLPSRRVVEVAIKIAKTTEMSKEKIKEMMKEARLMRNYDHPNVVKMYGVCVEHEPLLIVMELIKGGALDDYLKKNKVALSVKLDNMVLGSAWGLEYLHSRNCIHRDIAARNCLYTNDGQCKISDFGLSREGDHYQMTKVRRVPIKWLAPETITKLIYTAKTDVWSYGIMVWEIYANAAEPYPGMKNAEVKEKVTTGYKMTFPSETPKEIVDVVHNMCWLYRPEERSSMARVTRTLEHIAGKKAPVYIAHYSEKEVRRKSLMKGGSLEDKILDAIRDEERSALGKNSLYK